MLSQSLLLQHQGTKICDQPKYHQIASDGIDSESVATGSSVCFLFNLYKMVHHTIIKIHSSKMGVSSSGLHFKIHQNGCLLNLAAQ
ncbi:unnamed protein product, partial [Vitis vinifera]